MVKPDHLGTIDRDIFVNRFDGVLFFWFCIAFSEFWAELLGLVFLGTLHIQ